MSFIKSSGVGGRAKVFLEDVGGAGREAPGGFVMNI